MALWNNTTKPQWLLTSGGNNDTNETAAVDDLPGIGWRIWHAKDGGTTPGQGRGWWEILATQDVTGTSVDMAPIAGSVGDINLTNGALGLPVAFTVSATDDDNNAITYAVVSTVNCTATIDANTGVGSLTVVATDVVDEPTSITWKATANGVDTADQTITININAA